jgi:hypothetical protein
MPRLGGRPTRVEAAGNKPKQIAEYVGRVNTATGAVSLLHMKSPRHPRVASIHPPRV